MICGIKDRSTPCNRSSLLFTLPNGADAREIIERMKDIKARTDIITCFSTFEDGIVDVSSLVN